MLQRWFWHCSSSTRALLFTNRGTKMRVLCSNEGFISNFELLELLRQRTQEPGHTPRYPQPHDPFPTELQVSDA